ncbi:PREDICTED: ubiquitin carboxyl-terminal hydrolase 19 isoform X1 [Ficedula albicollis]|uniref:ubiquitin carboxyl-terminal hydrolase 19 isoform X1 n=1 Tax=Ficedula albicollis TaxID=59894 RepID=UPI00035950A9|nr:PREDICTED: ubiquitin carboxyl-terminal hydrolase 19 isoform X1 [Ficedula albicollis]XP_005053256.1 PREDICTED: ubiquitin carboxyl-terminal hydrolase 19 isoform X1 [Ficedula albicollis]
MSSSTNAPGQRRASRGLDDATNKKKQKDRANQESKEVSRPELEQAETAQEKDSEEELLLDWKQNADEIIIKLNLGSGALKAEDVRADFTDTDCVVKLPDGRQWSCQFYEEIEGSCSKIQCKKGNFLQLVLQKKIPLHNWASLLKKRKDGSKEPAKGVVCWENGKEKAASAELTPAEPRAEGTEPPRSRREPSNPKRAPGRSEALGGKSPASPGTQSGPSAKRAVYLKVAPTEEEPSARVTGSTEPGKGHSGRAGSRRNGRASQADAPVALADLALPLEKAVVLAKETVPVEMPPLSATTEVFPHRVATCVEKRVLQPGSPAEALLSRDCLPILGESSKAIPLATPPVGRDVEKRDWSKDEVALEAAADEPEPFVSLTFVKNDSYEKGNDLVVVHVYVKEIHKETSKVLFREQDFTLVFQTSDTNFLRLHPGCGPHTVFRWQVKLRNLIEPDQCTYNFTVSRIDVCLKKRQSQRWGGLEAPATRGAVGGAKVAMPTGPTPLDKNPPGSNQHPLSSKEEARTSDKEKPRVEDGALDGVAARTAPEHLAVKQEPHIPSPKPTCMVPPMTHSPVSAESVEDDEDEDEKKKVCLPGFTGLVNLGNTCFMNSVIQSLSNTRELRDYFHDRSFESEINYNNPLGTGGRLAIGFAMLLRALWKGTHHAFQPSKLKAIVASKASQFTGYAQHDAQEFMAFLLDGLHEDLNRIQNKPYTETVDSDGRPDEVVAEEAWQRHKMRNDSFIVDLFQGQYKSKLVCPVCSKVSITFDPFLYLPVPLPQKQKVLTVYYFAKEPHKKPIKFLVSISKENSSAMEVLDSVAHSVRVKPENLRLAEVVKNHFHRMFLPSNSLDTVSPTDLLLCFEVLSPELAKERVVELQVQQRPQVPSGPVAKCAACQKKQLPEDEKLKRCTRCYRVGYCNVACQKTHWPDHKASCRPENIGFPFLISVPESRLTYARLAQLLEGYARYSVSVFQPPFQLGRMSPEQGLQPLHSDKLEPLAKSSCAAATSASELGDGDRISSLPQEPPLSPAVPELQPEMGDTTTVRSKVLTARSSLLSLDSGFSEHMESQGDSCCEKEPSYERALKPEAAIPGYQHTPDSLSARATQFYITKIDAANREQKLEDKGDTPLDLTDDCSLALVWQNNERLKEFVLVESKELECVEDPGSASEAARAGHFTLEQCLNLFTKPEVLAPEEAWYCPKCKQHREASKQLMLWRLPNVLIIQLKRFSFRSFIWRDKINDMVDFPVRSLDLSKFCIGRKGEQQLPMYDLYAVINHYGGMIGGHYTAYARLPNDKNSQRSDVGWRLFDDSTVTTVDESQVVTRYAYVLFYRRRNSPVERPLPGHPSDHRAERTPSAEAAASQASLIWQELEAEEQELQLEAPQRRARNSWRPCGQKRSPGTPQHPDEGCVRYFVLATTAAIVALFLNVFYPLIYQPRWR